MFRHTALTLNLLNQSPKTRLDQTKQTQVATDAITADITKEGGASICSLKRKRKKE